MTWCPNSAEISHGILKPGMPAHRKVVEAFRSFPGVVTAGGDIDRAELRKLVFSGDFGVLGLMGGQNFESSVEARSRKQS